MVTESQSHRDAEQSQTRENVPLSTRYEETSVVLMSVSEILCVGHNMRSRYGPTPP